LNYIGYKELDKLLYKIPQLRAKAQNLRIEIAKLQDNTIDKELHDDILYSLYIGNREFSDMPPGNFMDQGDKLLKAIQRKDRIVDEILPRELIDMYIVIADATNKVDVALTCLSDQEKQLIELKHFHGKELKEISEIMHFAPSWLGTIKKTAIEKMVGVLHMEVDQWTYCMERVR